MIKAMRLPPEPHFTETFGSSILRLNGYGSQG
jgi:hypothetical protein